MVVTAVPPNLSTVATHLLTHSSRMLAREWRSSRSAGAHSRLGFLDKVVFTLRILFRPDINAKSCREYSIMHKITAGAAGRGFSHVILTSFSLALLSVRPS